MLEKFTYYLQEITQDMGINREMNLPNFEVQKAHRLRNSEYANLFSPYFPYPKPLSINWHWSIKTRINTFYKAITDSTF